jgi:hypothetical protein
MHIAGDRTGNKNTIGMAGGSHELDAEPAQIKNQGPQHIDIRLAPVAPPGGNLTKLERPLEHGKHLLFQRSGKGQFRAVKHEVLPAANGKPVVIAECQGAVRTDRAVGTEKAAAEINLNPFTFTHHSPEWTAFITVGTAGGAFSRLKNREAAETFRNNRFLPGKTAGPVALPESFTNNLQHAYTSTSLL